MMNDPRLRVVHQGRGDGREILAALDQTIAIKLPPGATWGQQLLALTLGELLGRVCRRIALVDPSETRADRRLPPGPASLAERFDAARRHGMPPLKPGRATMTVAIGQSSAGDLHLDGDGWTSYVGVRRSELEPSPSSVPVGPLLAAARGGARVVAGLLGDQMKPRPQPEAVYSSGLTYESSASPLMENVPVLDPVIEAVQFGAGSVGGASVYLFANTPGLRGTLDLVDPQLLEDRNFLRAILASRSACISRDPKAEIAAAALGHHHLLRSIWHRTTARGFVGERPRVAALPLVLSPVDSVAARREIQDCGPRDVINAACSPDEAVVSAHRTDDGPCLYCLHIPEVLDEQRITLKLVAAATGLPSVEVLALWVNPTALVDEHLRRIESHRGLAPGALVQYRGRTLAEIYRSELMYGEMAIAAADGTMLTIPWPFVTALTGFLLASEALKFGAGRDFAPYRLGVTGGLPTKYRESIEYGPMTSLLTHVARHEGDECLCRSTRRLRLLRNRYAVS